MGLTDSYKSPEWILKLVGKCFDPCPLNENYKIDGLKINWKKRNYVNPPYSNPLPWIEKAILEQKKGNSTILLLKLDCSTKWYKLLVEADAHFFFINERVKFNGKTPPFCNVLVFLE